MSSSAVCRFLWYAPAVADVFLVPENLVDGAGVPFGLTRPGEDSVRFKPCGDLIHAFAFEVFPVNPPNDFGLFRIDDQVAISVFGVAGFGMALMLAARNHGVDSIPAYEIVKFPTELRPLLSVPEDEEIIMGIALGYASEDSLNGLVSTRLPLEDILIIKE